jgi:O-antigen/teichoic acid export membrane protein
MADLSDPGAPADADPELVTGAVASASPDALDGPEAAGRLVRGGVLRFLSYAATTLLAVGSAAALTRHLGAGRFGLYTTVISLVTIVSVVTDSGMSNIGTREYATLHGEHRDALLRELLGLRVALTLVGVVFVAVWSLAAGYPAAVLVGGLGASLATVALVFQHTLTIPLTTDLRLGALSALELGRQAAMVAGILVLVALGAGLEPLLAVTLLTNTLLILPTARLVRGRISLRPALHLREWPALLRATVAFSLATAVGTIYVYAAQVLSGFVTSRYQAGLFAVSFRVFIAAASVPALVVGAALPVLSRAARDDRDRLGYVLQRIFETSLIGGTGVALTLSAGAHFIVSVVSGYHGAGAVLALQAWAMIPSFVIANWSYGLLSLHEHRALLIVNVAALAVSIGLTLVLAHDHGARGAAVATIAGETTLALGSILALAGRHPQYRPQLGVAPKVALALAVAATLAFVPDLPSLIRAVVALAVYSAAIVSLRALPPEFRALLPARRR